MTSQVDYYIRLFREGDEENAFFGLLEAGPESIADLMAVFRTEPDREVRAFLIRMIWNHREPSTVSFLGEALYDPEPLVWKEAIDGLVTLALQSALDVLRSARMRQFPNQRDADEFRGWIEEAIKQVEGTLPPT